VAYGSRRYLKFVFAEVPVAHKFRPFWVGGVSMVTSWLWALEMLLRGIGDHLSGFPGDENGTLPEPPGTVETEAQPRFTSVTESVFLSLMSFYLCPKPLQAFARKNKP
jgi:hypothetical protein